MYAHLENCGFEWRGKGFVGLVQLKIWRKLKIRERLDL